MIHEGHEKAPGARPGNTLEVHISIMNWMVLGVWTRPQESSLELGKPLREPRTAGLDITFVGPLGAAGGSSGSPEGFPKWSRELRAQDPGDPKGLKGPLAGPQTVPREGPKHP